MKIKATCSQCGGSITKGIEVGDIITLRDGSGMPNGLHHVLWNGHYTNPCDLPLPAGESFKPVRVLRIEGDTLAVLPLHWDDQEVRHKGKFDLRVYPAISWIAGIGDVFWIYAPHCHPIISTK